MLYPSSEKQESKRKRNELTVELNDGTSINVVVKTGKNSRLSKPSQPGTEFESRDHDAYVNARRETDQ